MRYVLFDSRHLGKTKVEAATEILARLWARPLGRSQAQRSRRPESNPEERDRMALVVCAVDTYDARRDIAGELPREIVNAGTTPRDFTISKHGFADGFACLACLYPPREQDVEQAAVMARELGLERTSTLHLQRTKEPLRYRLLERVAVARDLPPATFGAYASASRSTASTTRSTAPPPPCRRRAGRPSLPSPSDPRSPDRCSREPRSCHRAATRDDSEWTS